jgi:PKD repeat protein
VFDSLETWNIGIYEPQAGYSWYENGSGIQFVNESINSNTYQWFFGDGFSSTEQSPLHVYSIPGNYNVKQIVSDGCNIDTLVQVVEVIATGLCSDILTSELSIFPNPFTTFINIEFPQERKGTYFVELDKADGSVIQIDCIQPSSDNRLVSINTGNLPSGVYIIRIDSSKGIVVRKAVKIK